MSFQIFVKERTGKNSPLTGLNADTTVATAMQLHHKLHGGPVPDQAVWIFGGDTVDTTMTLDMAGIGESSVINCSIKGKEEPKAEQPNTVDFHSPGGVVSAQIEQAK